MKRVVRMNPVRGLFKATVKWYLLLGIIFSAFFFETWLQLQVYRNDYESASLNREIKKTVQQINLLQDKADELATMDRLNAKAPDLGLVEPNPQQIQVVYPHPVLPSVRTAQSPSYAVASLDTKAEAAKSRFGAASR